MVTLTSYLNSTYLLLSIWTSTVTIPERPDMLSHAQNLSKCCKSRSFFEKEYTTHHNYNVFNTKYNSRDKIPRSSSVHARSEYDTIPPHIVIKYKIVTLVEDVIVVNGLII